MSRSTVCPDTSVDEACRLHTARVPYLQYSAAEATPEAAQTSPLVTRTPRPVRWLTNDRAALDIRAAFRDHPSSHRLPISRRHRVHLIVCHLYRENRINDTQLIRWHESSERKGNNYYL